MLRSSRLWVLLLTLFFATVTAHAQNNGVLQGHLQDSLTNENIRFATITVYSARDSSIISYRLSDENGRFKIPQLPVNKKLRILISFTGYKVIRLENELTATNPEANLGKLLMMRDSKTLEEVLVIGERPPVIVRNDTIEFNAASFKTLPNALLEDLLKKLPGVMVERDGSITVNGRAVDRIMVDGKAFFGNDFRIATKNLPADVIDKVQVMNDPELREANIFYDPANEPQVINIKLKKGVKKALFGKVYAGAGTEKHYEAGGILNMFRDTLQVSLIGYSNDINRVGFSISEVSELGGFERAGINSMAIYSGKGFAINGIAFGNTSNGLERSTGGGVNFNTELGKNVSANVSYFYGKVHSTMEQLTENSLFLNDTVLNTNTRYNRAGEEFSHRFGSSIKWKPSALMSLTLSPSVTLSNSDQLTSTIASAEHSFKGLLNSSNIQQRFSRKFASYATRVSFSQGFKKSGRALTIYSYISQKNENNNDGNVSAIEYHAGGSGTTLQDQLRVMDVPDFNWSSAVGFAEPISKSLGLKINQSVNYSHKKDQLEVFEKVAGNAPGELNEELSNLVQQDTWTYLSTAGLTWKVKRITFTPNLSYQMLLLNNEFDKSPDSKLRYNNILPGLTLDWSSKINMTYNSSVTAPLVKYLQPVMNNSNPLFVELGNPDLKPTRADRLSVSYRYFKSAYETSYSIQVNGSTEKNGIVLTRRINGEGAQVSMPVNSPLSKGYRGEFSTTRKFKMGRGVELNASSVLSYSYNRSFIEVNENSAYQYQNIISERVRLNFNWNDKFEWSQGYSVSFNFNRYNNDYYQQLRNTMHYINTDLVLRTIKDVVLETSANYVYNPQSSAGIPSGAANWNAAINYLFLRNKKGTLKLQVYDILNQQRNLTRVVQENAITTTSATGLQRYFLCSFLYSIRDFKTRKVGGRESLLGM